MQFGDYIGIVLQVCAIVQTGSNIRTRPDAGRVFSSPIDENTVTARPRGGSRLLLEDAAQRYVTSFHIYLYDGVIKRDDDDDGGRWHFIDENVMNTRAASCNQTAIN